MHQADAEPGDAAAHQNARDGRLTPEMLAAIRKPTAQAPEIRVSGSAYDTLAGSTNA